MKKQDILQSRLSDFGGSTRKPTPAVNIGGKPKPPPTTQKPAKVGKTPSSKTLEDVSGELKSLKDLVTKMQLEFKLVYFICTKYIFYYIYSCI